MVLYLGFLIVSLKACVKYHVGMCATFSKKLLKMIAKHHALYLRDSADLLNLNYSGK